jgi:hypothetical protein
MPDLDRRNPFPSPVAEARARRAAERRTRARPVFVDERESHRWARLAALGAGTVVAVYLAVVGLTFVGAPGLRELETPGLGEFARPAGSRHADVGASPETHAVPEALAGFPGSEDSDATSSTTSEGGSADTSEGGSAEAPAAGTPASPLGLGPTTTVSTTTSTPPTPSSMSPTRSSTVPEPPGGNGPPTTPPGKP